MNRMWLAGLALAWAAGGAAWAEQVVVQGGGGPGWSYPGYYRGQGQTAADLTIEEQRKLGLSEEQIRQIAEKRRDLEKEHAKLEEQLKTAQEAARAANAEVTRLTQEVYTTYNLRIRKVFESVMTEAQLKQWQRQRYVEQAKQWLGSYRQWLKLTDAQVDDIAALLVPVFEKYDKMEADLSDARQALAEARQAEKLDLAAIDRAEKRVEELSKQRIWEQRQNELVDAMGAGLMPDQIEKFDRMRPRK